MRLAYLLATCLCCAAACGDGNTPFLPDAHPTDDAGCDLVGSGAFRMTWSMTSGGAPITCNAAGASRFDLLSTDALGNGVADRYICTNMMGTTGGLAVGTYTYVGSLLDDALVSVADSPPATAKICHDGEIVDLPPFVFDL